MRSVSSDRAGWPISIVVDGVTLFSDGVVDGVTGTVRYWTMEQGGVWMSLTRDEVDAFPAPPSPRLTGLE